MTRTLTLVVVPVVVAIVGYGAFIFLGAWIDGRRQAVREKGLHPVTEPDGRVEAREYATKTKRRELSLWHALSRAITQ